jgi:predicted RNA-binding Zn-ribbon protein involved in translation (DUF1610 family)
MTTNDITNCLECNKQITELQPKEGKEITCPHCGCVHVVELSWTLRNTGQFKSTKQVF